MDAEIAPDFATTLEAAGFAIVEGTPKSALVELLVAVAQSEAAWAAIGAVVVAFLRRHSGRRVTIEGDHGSLTIEGHSPAETEAAMQQLIRPRTGHEPQRPTGSPRLGREG
jgi:hypothetical protein